MTKRVYNPCICVFIVLLLLFGTVCGIQSISFVYAESGYSSVLADLQKDESFNIADYPDDPKDYSVKVIQIAESEEKELFVYTYQPSQGTQYLVATNINMSLSESATGTRLYELSLLSCDGVFCKYRADGIKVKDESARYYNITSIYREFNASIDSGTGNDNIKNGVAYPVGKLFTAVTENGNVSYGYSETTVITIKNPYVDFLRYSDGLKFFFIEPLYKYTDVHYIAFDTDLPIDTLKEADVSFRTQTYEMYGSNPTLHYMDEPVTHNPVTIYGTEKGGNAADGLFAKKYEWNRIQSTKEFLKTDGLKDETKESIKNTKWVLCFYETEVKQQVATLEHQYGGWRGTKVSDVTILRLKFVTGGKLYDLGAVSDKVTGDNKPGNKNTNERLSLWEWLEKITGVPAWGWKLIALCIVLLILLPLLAIIFPAFGQALLWILKGLGWLICLPFRGIAALVRKIKDKGDDSQ